MREQSQKTKRRINLGLVLTRRKTGEVLLAAGGRWDPIEERFAVDSKGVRYPPKRWHVVGVEESQVEFVLFFASWLQLLREGKPRDVSLALAAGDRRGGKTFCLLLCTVALLVDCPTIEGSLADGWVVSANYGERDELDRTIREYIPSSWYVHRKAPQFSYKFLHGPLLRNVSADDPETLKRGRVDVVFYNEAQKLPIAALTNGIYGTADKGGIALLAANPPRRMVGEWVYKLKQSLDEGEIAGVRYFGFSSKDNTQIDQAARSRVGGIVKILDPKAYAADDESTWRPVGDRAYYDYRGSNAVNFDAYLPDIGAPRDVTEEWSRRKAGRRFPYVGGVDFQGTPHHAGVVGRLFEHGDGRVELLVVQEFLVEDSTEDDFLDEVDEAGYAPENLLWVGDASGQWQDGKHDFSGGRGSFDLFKRRRWHIKPPTVKKTDRGEHSKNPAVEDRLGLVNHLLKTGVVKVDKDACPRLVEALKECPVAEGKFRRLRPYGVYSHITDACGYLVYYLFAPKRKQGPSKVHPGAGSFPNLRPGAGLKW